MNEETHLTTYVLDTNILLGTKKLDFLLENIQASGGQTTIPYTVLLELENQKTREGEIGFKARRALRWIGENLDSLKLSADAEEMQNDHSRNDKLIVQATLNREGVLLTNDLAMDLLATSQKIETLSYEEMEDPFRPGFAVLDISELDVFKDKEISKVMQAMIVLDTVNKSGLQPGEFLVMQEYGMNKFFFEITEGGGFTPIITNRKEQKIMSTAFGTLTPKRQDIAQELAFYMLGRSEISLLTGPAGTGKTLLMLAKQMEMLEKGEITRITVFTNPEKTRDSKVLGFYKGDRNMKLLQESVGGILASKLGSMDAVEAMIESEELVILPISDIRGYEVSDYSSLYITEAQNLTADQMQLVLQRAGEGVKVFVEGDPNTQLDSWKYEGDNNGIGKMIEVFTGTDVFHHIHLDKIYRSRIADLAEKMAN